MFRSYSEGELKGISFLKLGNRYLLDVCITKESGNELFGLGISSALESPIFFGVNFLKRSLFIEVLGVDFANDKTL